MKRENNQVFDFPSATFLIHYTIHLCSLKNQDTVVGETDSMLMSCTGGAKSL
jgi:hypothetical protein